MARLEALIDQGSEGMERQAALIQLADRLGGELLWLDERNAAMTLILAPEDLPVQVLLELRQHGELAILIKSSERMGSGAPLSRTVLDQLVAGLLQATGGARVLFRSDRDGPIRPTAPKAAPSLAAQALLAAAS